MARTSKSRQTRRAIKQSMHMQGKTTIGLVGAIGTRSTLATDNVMLKSHTMGCHVPIPHARGGGKPIEPMSNAQRTRTIDKAAKVLGTTRALAVVR